MEWRKRRNYPQNQKTALNNARETEFLSLCEPPLGLTAGGGGAPLNAAASKDGCYSIAAALGRCGSTVNSFACEYILRRTPHLTCSTPPTSSR